MSFTYHITFINLVALLAVGIILGIVDQFTDFKVTFAVWSTMFGTGAALIGVTALPNIKQ